MREKPVQTLEISTLLQGESVTLVMFLGKKNTLCAVLYQGIDIFPVLGDATLCALENQGRAAALDWHFENRSF